MVTYKLFNKMQKLIAHRTKQSIILLISLSIIFSSIGSPISLQNNIYTQTKHLTSSSLYITSGTIPNIYLTIKNSGTKSWALPKYIFFDKESTMQFNMSALTVYDFSTQIDEKEYSALVALYDSTNGENWSNHNNWLSTYSPCSWYGVTCNAGHISELYLKDNNLVGSIPPEIAKLSSLTKLVLSDNYLTGNIPAELGNLPVLKNLYLSNNQLSGNIPAELGNLTTLQNLYLSNNQLTRTIPPELGNLTALTVLALNNNRLIGSIPVQLGNLTALTFLALNNNQLTGSIPVQLGNLTALTFLALNNNQLTGSIPVQLGNLTALTFLALNNNQLTGSIPVQLGNLTALKFLALNSNQLLDENLAKNDPISLSTGNMLAYDSISRLFTVESSTTDQLCGDDGDDNLSGYSSGTYSYDKLPNHLIIAAFISSHTLPHNSIPNNQPYEPITSREMEVYIALVEGKSNKEIADELAIDDKTVQAHIHSIFEKTNVCSRAGAITFAFKYELIDIHSVNIRRRYREKPS